MLDTVIIGSGPAGLAAAIYASRAALNYVVLEKAGYSGGQIVTTNDLDIILVCLILMGLLFLWHFKNMLKN